MSTLQITHYGEASPILFLKLMCVTQELNSMYPTTHPFGIKCMLNFCNLYFKYVCALCLEKFIYSESCPGFMVLMGFKIL